MRSEFLSKNLAYVPACVPWEDGKLLQLEKHSKFGENLLHEKKRLGTRKITSWLP